MTKSKRTSLKFYPLIPSFPKYFLSFALLCSFLFLFSCRKEKYQRDEGMTWNTLYHITYQNGTSLHDSIVKVFKDVNKSLSVFDTTSLVTKANRQKSIQLDELFLRVYAEAVRINEKSGGVFDPTLSPLITAWGFGPGHSLSADTLAIDSIMEFVGIKKTRVEGNMLVKEDIRTQFNFSGIAKGFGCDLIGEMMHRNGVENFMIEIGGELTLSGKSPSGGKWRISVDTPKDFNDSHEAYLILETTDCGIATSGNYRNFKDTGNGKIAHTISPLTGRPVQTDVLSATVIAPTCMMADAAATTCMASGSQKALKFLKEMNFEGLLILPDTCLMTPGFRNIVAE